MVEAKTVQSANDSGWQPHHRGSGKTPMIAYLLDHFSNHFSLAVLSRGYKRKSSGFVLANQESSIESLGDETFLLSQKFPTTHFGVCKNRLEGVEQLLSKFPTIDGVLLDDGYQHRQLKPSFSNSTYALSKPMV